MTTLTRKTGLAERTVQAALLNLSSLGELQVDYNGGPRRCNLYRVVMGTPAGDAPPQEMHPAGDAPPQEMHPNPAGDAGGTPQEMHPEPSIEPSRNRQVQTVVDPAAPDRPGTLPTAAAIRQVWEAYLDACQQVGVSHNARLTDRRRDKIRTRLKSFPLQDVVDAAWGWTRDPWPERRRNCDAVIIFRSDEQVEKFRDLWRDGPPPVVSKQATQAMQTSAAMRARAEEVNRRERLQRMGPAGAAAQHGLPAPAD